MKVKNTVSGGGPAETAQATDLPGRVSAASPAVWCAAAEWL